LAKRTNSPWSKTYKEGLPTTAVDDHVNINQTVSGTITTGVIDSATGQWQGITVSDSAFTLDAVHEAVPNGGAVTSPQGAGNEIAMTGFNDVTLAIKPTITGNYALIAVMGGDDYYANLTPPNGGATLIMQDIITTNFERVLDVSAEALTADVWNIFTIHNRARGQKLMQLKITNNTGSEADIQFAYLRVV